MHEVGGGAGGGEAGPEPLPGGHQTSQHGVGGAAGQAGGKVGRRCVSAGDSPVSTVNWNTKRCQVKLISSQVQELSATKLCPAVIVLHLLPRV